MVLGLEESWRRAGGELECDGFLVDRGPRSKKGIEAVYRASEYVSVGCAVQYQCRCILKMDNGSCGTNGPGNGGENVEFGPQIP